MSFVFLYVYWCLNTIFMSDDVCVSFNSNTTGVTSMARTDNNPSKAPEFTPRILVWFVLLDH